MFLYKYYNFIILINYIIILLNMIFNKVLLLLLINLKYN
jgi:hypothetical protein